MKTIGFPISHKENEKRRALVPTDIVKIKHPEQIYIETGYGDVLCVTDDDYKKMGVNIVSREETLKKDIICDPKIGDANYLKMLSKQTIFGWIHAVQNKDITDNIVNGKLTAYAWEDMFKDNRHTFWENNEIAGEAAVFHAYMCHGVFPFKTKAAVLGRGNTARGAMKTLNYMGADVTQYDRHTEALFQKELEQYDVVVNCILWDTSRHDHIIYRKDLKRMKPGALIIDVSCDKNGGIETSIPTTIEQPIYIIDGITHYVVDHTPSIFWKTTSQSISAEVAKYLDFLIEGSTSNRTLNDALIIRDGEIIDERINNYQHRK